MNWGNIFADTASGAGMGAPFGPWGAVIGGGLGLATGLFGGDPEEEARKQMEKSQDQSKQYQMPFVQGGTDQYNRLNQASNDLLNPQDMENRWADYYKNSPYANQLLAQNQASGMDAASQMGLGGSSAALGNIQQGAGNIYNQQRQQYMDDMMKKYMAGIGLSNDIYKTGASAAGKLGEQEVGHGLVNAALSYNQTNRPMQTLASAGGGLLDFYKSNPQQFKDNWKGFLS